MLKNIRIGVKLVIVGALLIILPLVVVAVFAVSRATAGLTASVDEQLTARTATIAQMVDSYFAEEKKLALSYASDPDVVQAAAAAAQAERAPEPATSVKKATPTIATGPEALARVTAKLAAFKATKGLGESYQVVLVADAHGKPLAASDPVYLGADLGTRDYFKAAMAGAVTVGATQLNKATNKPITTVAAPILVGGKSVGVVGLGMDIGVLMDFVAKQSIGATGYAFMLDSTGLALAHPNPDNVFKLNLTELDGTRDFATKMIAGEHGVDTYVFQGVAKTAGYAPVTATGWSVGLTLPDSEYLSTATSIRNLVFVISAVALALAVLIYVLFSRTITRPLARGVAFAESVAAGDFSQQLAIDQRDEVGALASALNGMSVKLRGMVSTIKESAVQVASASEQITASAQKLSEGAQSQASTLEETSASVEELTASVDQVAEHAQTQAAAVEEGSSSMSQVHQSIEDVSHNLTQISNLAGTSVENALEGTKAVTEVVDGINLIAGSSEKIGGIVTVIADIADQTNLLALNASIEAARAGEHGRGFAVVADEVSKLAERSSASTKEIESLIRESARNVTRGVETAKGSQLAMEHIRAASQQVREMIAGLSQSMTQQVHAVKELSAALGNVSEMSQSISAATEEQTTNAKQVSKAVESVNEITQSAASAAEEMSASTEQLSRMAQELQRMTDQFRIGAEEVVVGGGRRERPGDATAA